MEAEASHNVDGANLSSDDTRQPESRELDGTILEICALFDRDGYFVRRGVIGEDIVLAEWKLRADEYFHRIFVDLHEHGHTAFPMHNRVDDRTDLIGYAMGQGVKNGFKEIVMRSPGRYELNLAYSDLFRDISLESYLKEKLSFVPLLLGANHWGQVRIISQSLVVSTPGSPDQSWHADGPHMNLREHLPCHCLNIFIPLSDITISDGPTELRPGTHYHTRNLVPMLLSAKARKTLQPTVAPLLNTGDVLIFDYRILHRGRANRSPTRRKRIILVLTVSQPWFRDVLNFSTRSLFDPVHHNSGENCG